MEESFKKRDFPTYQRHATAKEGKRQEIYQVYVVSGQMSASRDTVNKPYEGCRTSHSVPLSQSS